MARYPSFDVLIVGGGPAGLATAIAARRHGLTVAVADGAIPPIDKSCGEGLMPDGIEALGQLGITIPESEMYPFRGIRFIHEAIKERSSAEAPFPCGTAYGIRRTVLHRIMTEHATACGAELFWQTPVSNLHPEGAIIGGELLRARWIVGADGSNSCVRRWADLDRQTLPSRALAKPRFGFRRHYRVAPWTDFMELHWGLNCQIYLTPVSSEEVCLALISSNSKLRLDEALSEFPELRTRLEGFEHSSNERGAFTTTRSFQRVYRGHIALVGDASGGVDAITGDGLSLAFRQSILLSDCLADENLALYQAAHRTLFLRPTMMSRIMLSMANSATLRSRVIQVFQSNPRAFTRMLAMHIGEGSTHNYISAGLGLGWKLLTAN